MDLSIPQREGLDSRKYCKIERSCLKAAVLSSFMSTENLAILHVDFGARILMAMLYSLNHGSDE